MTFKITDDIDYIGVNDKTLDLFESQYLVPNGVSYNSYIINDDKIVVMDTVDRRATNEWIENLEKTLGDRKPDYLVVSHLEPDHSANILLLTEKYPDMKIILSKKASEMMSQFFDTDLSSKFVIVSEGEKEKDRAREAIPYYKDAFSEHVYVVTAEPDFPTDPQDLKFSYHTTDILSPMQYVIPFQVLAALICEDVGIDTTVSPVKKRYFSSHYKA